MSETALWYFATIAEKFRAECAGFERSEDHEHVEIDVEESGFYPEGLGEALLRAAREVDEVTDTKWRSRGELKT